MSPSDAAGVFGVGLILVAYAGATTGRLDPKKVPALTLNFVGAGLVLFSLAYDFNLAAVIMEAVWGLVALLGLVRLGFKRRP